MRMIRRELGAAGPSFPGEQSMYGGGGGLGQCQRLLEMSPWCNAIITIIIMIVLHTSCSFSSEKFPSWI